MPEALTTLAVLLTAGTPSILSTPPDREGAINVRSFQGNAIQPGTEQEDWQPAFQKAIALAQRELRPVYVPAGLYKIRRAIRIVPVADRKTAPLGQRSVRIVGDGRYQTCISQEVETENVIDWTGLEYETPCTHGELLSIGLRGGRVALNLKWHNYFSLDSCYIHGPRQFGIYTEGWSSRFRNSIIRWCREAGIRGTAHFNNNVVRDCYFSRDGVGIHFTGGYGNRVEGCGLERCAKAALFLRGTNSFTINNCYFEGNGYKTATKHFDVQGTADTVHLDYSCQDFSIHDNIFRSNLDKDGACLSIAHAVRGHIYDNLFFNMPKAIELRTRCETNENAKPCFGRTIVEDNQFQQVEHPLSEAGPGLIERALEQGSAFRLRRQPVCQGSPTGVIRPECLGDEILDQKAKCWYKAVGPKATDWVALNAK